MSLSLFIARRIYRESDGGKQVSRPAVLIAMAGYWFGRNDYCSGGSHRV